MSSHDLMIIIISFEKNNMILKLQKIKKIFIVRLE